MLFPLRGAFRKLRRFLLRNAAPPSAPTAPPRSSLPAHHPDLIIGFKFPCSLRFGAHYANYSAFYYAKKHFRLLQLPRSVSRCPPTTLITSVLCMAIISPFQRYKNMRRFVVFIIMLCGLWAVALLAAIIVCGMYLREQTIMRVFQIIRYK